MLKIYNPRTLSRHGGILQGCLIAVAIVFILLVAVLVFVVMNIRGWAAGVMQAVSEEAIKQSDLPETEKPEIIAIFDEFANSFKDGDVTWEELFEVFKDPDKSPVIAMGVVMQFEGAYVGASGLSDEEKEAAKLTLNRTAQGLASGALDWDQAGDILEPVTVHDDDGGHTLLGPSKATDDQIREVIALASAAVEEAGITDEYVEIDLSEEFRKHIEDRLGRAIGEAPDGG